MKYEVSDSLEFLKTLDDYSVDINYSDPPYALGSEIIIKENGKPDYKKAVDFMNKWEMPTGDYWEEWFKESYRSLKYGGYCIMFGIDRQQFLFEYYSNLAGFKQRQSMYWYFINSFPKSADLSKNMMKHFGDDGIETVVVKRHTQKGVAVSEERDAIGGGAFGQSCEEILVKPTNKMVLKYDGYKYSIAPMKQTCETIMIFQKSYKTGSCLHDTLAYENGDKECCCGALDINSGRVNFSSNDNSRIDKKYKHNAKAGLENGNHKKNEDGNTQELYKSNGRYPSQTFVDSDIAKILDDQSGEKKSNKGNIREAEIHNQIPLNNSKKTQVNCEYSDTGECSKILHKCDYTKHEHDLYLYNPKVSKIERNSGLDEFADNDRENRGNNQGVRYCTVCGMTDNGINDHSKCDGKFEYKLCSPIKNNHPTVKPIKLNFKILQLFKTPNSQKIIYPFAGVGSEIIGGEKVGFDNWDACEINEEWMPIAIARIKHWRTIDLESKKPIKKSTNKIF